MNKLTNIEKILVYISLRIMNFIIDFVIIWLLVSPMVYMFYKEIFM